MAINDGFYWCKNVLKKQLKLALGIYLSIAIVLSPIFLMSSANAANLNGWQVGVSGYLGGGKVGLEAVKDVMLNGQKHTKRSTSSLSVPALRVAKVLAGGVGAVALAEAVTMLLGAGVDWVLDPANSRVLYTDPQNPIPPTDPSVQYIYESSSAIGSVRQFSSLNLLCSYIKSVRNFSASDTCSLDTNQDGTVSGRVVVVGSNGVSYGQFGSRVANPAYNPSADKPEENQKSIPLTTVAAQVISNADSHSNPDQRRAAVATVEAAAQDIINEAEQDDSKSRPLTTPLESNASTATTESATGTATKPNTANPQAPPEVADIALEFPVFCSWAPTVCQAAQVVISFPPTLTNWWETAKGKAESWASSISESWAVAKEWATSEPQKDSNEFEFEDLNIDADQVNLSGSNTCPQDSVSFSVMGKSVTLDMPYQPVCDALSFFKPAVLLVGAVASVYIVAGVRKEEDQA